MSHQLEHFLSKTNQFGPISTVEFAKHVFDDIGDLNINLAIDDVEELYNNLFSIVTDEKARHFILKGMQTINEAKAKGKKQYAAKGFIVFRLQQILSLNLLKPPAWLPRVKRVDSDMVGTRHLHLFDWSSVPYSQIPSRHISYFERLYNLQDTKPVNDNTVRKHKVVTNNTLLKDELSIHTYLKLKKNALNSQKDFKISLSHIQSIVEIARCHFTNQPLQIDNVDSEFYLSVILKFEGNGYINQNLICCAQFIANTKHLPDEAFNRVTQLATAKSKTNMPIDTLVDNIKEFSRMKEQTIQLNH